MAEPMSAARLTIDLDALARNYRTLANLAAGGEAAPVLKADAYGLGAATIGRRLWAEGARRFFVARLAEGEALRAALGPLRPAIIHVLDGLEPETAPRLLAAHLSPVLHTLSQVRAGRALAATLDQTFSAALQIDTGMNRQGLTLEDVRALAAAPEPWSGLQIDLVLSHLGSASEPFEPRNLLQLDRFQSVRPLFPGAKASLAASAGIFLGSDYHFDVVRPGVSLFGGGPEGRPDRRLEPVVTFDAPILDIRDLQAGERVGYGSSLMLDRPVRAAVVAAGYADGVFRAAGSRASAWVCGRLVPLLVVTMDLIVLDIGDAPAEIGSLVELLGPRVLLDDLATASGTIAHECLVRLGGRGARRYLGEA